MLYDLLLSNSAKNRRRRTPVRFGAVLVYLQCKVQALCSAACLKSHNWTTWKSKCRAKDVNLYSVHRAFKDSWWLRHLVECLCDVFIYGIFLLAFKVRNAKHEFSVIGDHLLSSNSSFTSCILIVLLSAACPDLAASTMLYLCVGFKCTISH